MLGFVSSILRVAIHRLMALMRLERGMTIWRRASPHPTAAAALFLAPVMSVQYSQILQRGSEASMVRIRGIACSCKAKATGERALMLR